MKYTVVYHKKDPYADTAKKRTRFSSKKRSEQLAEFYRELGFKTMVMSKNDYESVYGELNNPRTAFNRVTDMALIASGNHNGPPYYNCDHLVKKRAFIFAPSSQPLFQ